MNYVAHAYLSGQNEQIIFGNLIGDFVKGNQFKAYPSDIQKGLLLHRNIDTFTDAHIELKKIKDILRQKDIAFPGVFIDIIFDYFLSNDLEKFPTEHDFEIYTKKLYAIIENNHIYLNARMERFFFTC